MSSLVIWLALSLSCLLGYTSELLRYAKLVPIDADPALEQILLP